MVSFAVMAFLLSSSFYCRRPFTVVVILLSASFYCWRPFTVIVINVVVATVVAFAALVSILLVKS
jgi:hypothetical protein